MAHIHASILHGSKCSKNASLRFKNACNYKLWNYYSITQFKKLAIFIWYPQKAYNLSIMNMEFIEWPIFMPQFYMAPSAGRTPAWDSETVRQYVIITLQILIRLRTPTNSQFSCTETAEINMNKESIESL